MFIFQGLNLGIFRETYEYGRLSDVCNVNVSVNIYDEGRFLIKNKFGHFRPIDHNPPLL